ncbi:hypothetical protein BN1221_02622c [Brenneria goodwinii]|uniref:Uncharacterized protein n=1 Tax=Brenneria goodwinii TaxID=1109412 RepID=A0A0G4JW59_9GAMM|nr:hypothetical protein BN1221_02622c [Brenneria goodwinii]
MAKSRAISEDVTHEYSGSHQEKLSDWSSDRLMTRRAAF